MPASIFFCLLIFNYTASVNFEVKRIDDRYEYSGWGKVLNIMKRKKLSLPSWEWGKQCEIVTEEIPSRAPKCLVLITKYNRSIVLKNKTCKAIIQFLDVHWCVEKYSYNDMTYEIKTNWNRSLYSLLFKF